MSLGVRRRAFRLVRTTEERVGGKTKPDEKQFSFYEHMTWLENVPTFNCDTKIRNNGVINRISGARVKTLTRSRKVVRENRL